MPNVTYKKPQWDLPGSNRVVSHFFYPDHIVQRSIKLLFWLFFLKNERSVKATSSDSALLW